VTSGSLYSYYRADPARREALRSAVEALFHAVAQTHGIQGRWMHRKDDPETFMEVYDGSADLEALVAFIRQECERTGFRQLLADAGARHDEIFVDAD
jgi:uncharacterized small protein (DUF1192 family)